MLDGNSLQAVCTKADFALIRYALKRSALYRVFFFAVIYCEPPQVTGSLVINVNGLHYGSVAMFWCMPGYTLIGNSTAVCTGSGHWSEPLPSCLPSKGKDITSSFKNKAFILSLSEYFTCWH